MKELEQALVNHDKNLTEILLKEISKELQFENISYVSKLLVEAKSEDALGFWLTALNAQKAVSMTQGVKYHAEAAHKAIIFAEQKGDKEIIDFIVKGEDVLKNMGMFLTLAIVKGEKSIVDSLLEADSYIANPEDKIAAKYKGSALGAAVRNNQEEILENILNKVGNDISLEDKAKAIKFSKQTEQEEMATKIMDNVSIEDKEALQEIASIKYPEIKELVENYYKTKVSSQTNIEEEADATSSLYGEEEQTNQFSSTVEPIGDIKHTPDEL